MTGHRLNRHRHQAFARRERDLWTAILFIVIYLYPIRYHGGVTDASPREPLIELLHSALHVARVLETRRVEDRALATLTPGERLVVLHLERHPGTSLRELAEHMNLQPSNASAMVRRLVDVGLVARHRDPADARRVSLDLTDRASADLEVVHAEWYEAVRGAGIDPADIPAALRVITAIDAWLSSASAN